MGLLSIIKKQKILDKELRILVLGLDNAGKTTIVKSILNQDTTTISPTVGFEINPILYNGYNLNIWDVGGQTSLRTFWGNYFAKTDIIIWVVDGLALERLRESYEELREKVISHDRLIGIKLLVLINKIDAVEGDPATLKATVTQMLNLHNELPLDDTWEIFCVSGKHKVGIHLALDWCTLHSIR